MRKKVKIELYFSTNDTSPILVASMEVDRLPMQAWQEGERDIPAGSEVVVAVLLQRPCAIGYNIHTVQDVLSLQSSFQEEGEKQERNRWRRRVLLRLRDSGWRIESGAHVALGLNAR